MLFRTHVVSRPGSSPAVVRTVVQHASPTAWNAQLSYDIEQRGGLLDEWSECTQRVDRADALLDALAGAIEPAVSSPSPTGSIARQGWGRSSCE